MHTRFGAPVGAPVLQLAFIIALLTIARASAAAGPTTAPALVATPPARSTPTTHPAAGLREYKDTFKVQQPYDLKVSDRFVEDKGVYTCWVVKGDKPLKEGSGTGSRTEMRWNKDWTKTQHMWEADVYVEPGTDHTCVMQIKSNTGGEVIYLQVQSNNLYNDNSTKTPAVKDFTGKWWHVICDYNPTTGDAHAWVNGDLVITRNYKKPLDTVWYFKNGVYNTANGSKAMFKNIRFYEAPDSADASGTPAGKEPAVKPGK